jgi:hypothetical protein
MRIFSTRQPASMAVVDAPVSQTYARKARLTLLVVSPVVGVLAAGVLAAFVPLLWAVALAVLLGPLCGLVAALWVSAWPVLRAVWHWLPEIVVTLVWLVTSSWLARVTVPWVPLLLWLLATGTVLAVPGWRRSVRAWLWCVIVRHRLRWCFAGFVRSAHKDRGAYAPLILVARPTPAGERVWVWLRAGLELADLEASTGRIAVGCLAHEVRLAAASTRFAALVRLDVIRRDPLTGVVGSPLAALVDWDDRDTSGGPVLVPQGLNLSDIPEPEQQSRESGGRGRR